MADTTKRKVLVVEDDRTLARLYATKLEKSGYEVEVAFDGKEGLEKAASFQPDVILLDIIIPKIDGFAVLEQLQKDPQAHQIAVILLTNLGQDEDVAKGKQLGARDYLVKSQFTPAEIVKKMEAALGKIVGG